jgi:hypothetical protein
VGRPTSTSSGSRRSTSAVRATSLPQCRRAERSEKPRCPGPRRPGDARQGGLVQPDLQQQCGRRRRNR